MEREEAWRIVRRRGITRNTNKAEAMEIMSLYRGLNVSALELEAFTKVEYWFTAVDETEILNEFGLGPPGIDADPETIEETIYKINGALGSEKINSASNGKYIKYKLHELKSAWKAIGQRYKTEYTQEARSTKPAGYLKKKSEKALAERERRTMMKGPPRTKDQGGRKSK